MPAILDGTVSVMGALISTVILLTFLLTALGLAGGAPLTPHGFWPGTFWPEACWPDTFPVVTVVVTVMICGETTHGFGFGGEVIGALVGVLVGVFLLGANVGTAVHL